MYDPVPARVIILIAIFFAVALCSGCSLAPERIDAGWNHDSHPTLGAPFGPSTEEDSLNTLGVRGSWCKGRMCTELGLGKKLGDGGFYGDSDLVFTSRVSVTLWERR